MFVEILQSESKMSLPTYKPTLPSLDKKKWYQKIPYGILKADKCRKYSIALTSSLCSARDGRESSCLTHVCLFKCLPEPLQYASSHSVPQGTSSPQTPDNKQAFTVHCSVLHPHCTALHCKGNTDSLHPFSFLPFLK